ncbi:MAG: translation initiation factor IF-3 [Planctomycetes bacterium]|nr:translation initiation factor IF-3 [Planctomycetota bacterium]
MSKGIQANLRCNEQIRLSPVRLVGAANEQIGVIETYQALQMAREQGLDLVEVAPMERPPVCRIMDYGKFKYQQKKGQKKHHEQQLKEVRLRPKTDDHDRQIKVNRAIKFLYKGDKVQFTMQFRGRERAHREIGNQIFHQILAGIQEYVKVERTPIMDGKNMVMIVAPVKAAIEKAIADGRLAHIIKMVEEDHDDDRDDDVDDRDDGGDADGVPTASQA